MSTQQVSQSSAADTSLANQIEEFFRHVEAAGPQPRWRHLTGVCQFNIEGAGTWQVHVKKGTVTVTKGEDKEVTPRCVISGTAQDFLRLLRLEGHLNVYAAVLQELITVNGEIPFAWAVLGTFELNPAQAQRR